MIQWTAPRDPRLRPPRGITLHIGTLLNHRITYTGPFDRASIYIYYRGWGPRRVVVANLMLTPKTIREVERCLLLVAKGRAEMMMPLTNAKPGNYPAPGGSNSWK